MSRTLARWLADNQYRLLPHWVKELEPVGASAAGNGTLAHGSSAAEPPIAHPDERGLLLTALYGALISAAEGDNAPLQECLRLLRALRTHTGEDELHPHLVLLFELRQAAWDELLQAPDSAPINPMQLAGELNQLLDSAAAFMADLWISAADSVRAELHETQQLVESLYHDAEATDRTTLQVSSLNQLAQGLSSSMDRDQQLDIVSEKLSASLGNAALGIWLLDPIWQHLMLAHTQGEPPSAPILVAPDAPGDLVAQAFRSGETIAESAIDATQQGRWYQPGCSVLAVPLLAQRQAIGVIVVQDTSDTLLLDRSQQNFIQSVASQAGIALENARLYEEVRSFNSVLEQRITERTRELQIERDMLETLHEIALETSSTLDRDSLLETSLEALAKLVNVHHGSIMLLEQETEHLIDCAVLGKTGTLGYTRFALGQGIAGWVAQHKKPTIVTDVNQDPRWVHLPHGEEAHKSYGSMIAVPLIAHHQVLGVLLLSHDDVGYFNDDHLRLLIASAGQIAIGINNAQLYTELEKELLHRSDMFQRQEAEASQSQAILQSLSDGVIVCGDDGAVLTANLAVERILDRSIEELLIWNLPELLQRLLGRRAAEVPLAELLANPLDANHQLRTFSTNLEVETRMINLTLGPVLNSKESLLGAVAVFRDITREVESDRLKTEFIGTVSHELRTPMTSIKGFTQLLAMGSLGPVNDTQKEFLQIIQTNAERMISIINDLLDITKFETGSVELELRPIHLAETLSSVMFELQSSIAAREHTLSISIPPGLPLVRADARRLNQILLNLLSNAVKYTPRSGKIKLEAREVSIDAVPAELREGLKPALRYALVEVSDTGVGIATEEQERIFERFYRTENPLKVEAGGTGLGLSLVRPLIQLLGGRIWVRSVQNEGSVFSFIVPAV